jgi:hypothetical protein
VNDAKPWVTWQVDGSTTWVGSNEDWRAKTIATCRQRDELVEVVRELVEALDRAVNLTCNCANDPEFKVLGHAPFCDARDVLAKWSGK